MDELNKMLEECETLLKNIPPFARCQIISTMMDFLKKEMIKARSEVENEFSKYMHNPDPNSKLN